MQNGTFEPGTAALGLVQLKQLVSRVQLKQLVREGGPRRQRAQPVGEWAGRRAAGGPVQASEV